MHGGNAGRPMTKGVHITHKSFTQSEWDLIKRRIDEKTRLHEFAVQVAQLAFEKIVKSAEEPITILAVAAEYILQLTVMIAIRTIPKKVTI